MDEYVLQELTVERTAPGAQGGSWVIAVAGDIDLAVADRFAEELRVDEDQGASVVIDMSETTFIDSSGIRVLLASHRAVTDEGGEWALVLKPDSVVERTLAMASLTETLPTYSSRDEASASLAS